MGTCSITYAMLQRWMTENRGEAARVGEGGMWRQRGTTNASHISSNGSIIEFVIVRAAMN